MFRPILALNAAYRQAPFTRLNSFQPPFSSAFPRKYTASVVTSRRGFSSDHSASKSTPTPTAIHQSISSTTRTISEKQTSESTQNSLLNQPKTSPSTSTFSTPSPSHPSPNLPPLPPNANNNTNSALLTDSAAQKKWFSVGKFFPRKNKSDPQSSETTPKDKPIVPLHLRLFVGSLLAISIYPVTQISRNAIADLVLHSLIPDRPQIDNINDNNDAEDDGESYHEHEAQFMQQIREQGMGEEHPFGKPHLAPQQSPADFTDLIQFPPGQHRPIDVQERFLSHRDFLSRALYGDFQNQMAVLRLILSALERLIQVVHAMKMTKPKEQRKYIDQMLQNSPVVQFIESNSSSYNHWASPVIVEASNFDNLNKNNKNNKNRQNEKSFKTEQNEQNDQSDQNDQNDQNDRSFVSHQHRSSLSESPSPTLDFDIQAVFSTIDWYYNALPARVRSYGETARAIQQASKLPAPLLTTHYSSPSDMTQEQIQGIHALAQRVLDYRSECAVAAIRFLGSEQLLEKVSARFYRDFHFYHPHSVSIRPFEDLHTTPLFDKLQNFYEIGDEEVESLAEVIREEAAEGLVEMDTLVSNLTTFNVPNQASAGNTANGSSDSAGNKDLEQKRPPSKLSKAWVEANRVFLYRSGHHPHSRTPSNPHSSPHSSGQPTFMPGPSGLKITPSGILSNNKNNNQEKSLIQQSIDSFKSWW